ncbi:nuclear transport factor 2 family protein [Litorivivens sp.]|uniref:nuclear transport factor 2 family protein n=1 Tax=Litorivivens sp. TaxID=2020868 RepID=UPI0035628C05
MTDAQVSMTPEKMAKLEELLHRQEIYDCLVRFSRGIDRFDREVFLSAFHEDAQISAGIFVGDPVSLYEWAQSMHSEGQAATQHSLLNHSCDIEGDIAHSETYYLYVGRNRDDTNWMAGGRYIDRLEYRAGQWKIAFRNNAIEWSGTVPTMDIPFADVADLPLNGVPSRDVNDPSYQRPLLNRRQPFIPGN